MASEVAEDYREMRERKEKNRRRMVECAGCGCKAWPKEKCMRCGEEN